MINQVAPQAILEVRDLTLVHGPPGMERPAITEFSARIAPGEALGLLEAQGVAAAAFVQFLLEGPRSKRRVAQGSVQINGRDVRFAYGDKIASIGTPSTSALRPSAKIGRQLIRAAVQRTGTTRAEARDLVVNAMHEVGVHDTAGVLDSYMNQLPPGDGIRVGLAMALLPNPSLLIVDRITAGLDHTVAAGLCDLLDRLRAARGLAVLAHATFADPVLESCERVQVICAGECVETGPTHDVLGRPRHPYTQHLVAAHPRPESHKIARPIVPPPDATAPWDPNTSGCRFAPHCAHVETTCRDAQRIPLLPVPRNPDQLSRCTRIEDIDWSAQEHSKRVVTEPAIGAPVLEVEGLCRTYSVPKYTRLTTGERVTFSALTGFDATLRLGETLAVLGESGSSKTTLAHLLAGLEQPTAGTITIDGHAIHARPLAKRDSHLLGSLQMVFPDPNTTLNPALTIAQQLGRTLEFLRPEASIAARMRRLDDALDLAKLPSTAKDSRPADLSAEQRQRVAIARAMSGGPKLLIADDPTSALSIPAQAAIAELLLDIQRATGIALLYLTRDSNLAQYLADRIVVLYRGTIAEAGNSAQVFAPPYHPYTEALFSAAPVVGSGASRQRIVLETASVAPTGLPRGCPFQTLCHRKAQVPGGLCEKEAPPQKHLSQGHSISCHLSDNQLAAMKPVRPTVADQDFAEVRPRQ